MTAKAILFDLDDTLLGNSMETFVPAYFRALTDFVSYLIPGERLLAELLRATSVIEANDGSGATNEEAFAAVFYPALGHERALLEPVFRRFYAEEFPALRGLTHRRPEARPLVEWVFSQGLQVVIATNPLFPRSPTEQRLEWAGVPATEFNYDLVTTYEVMHATKSSTAYYREIAARLGRGPSECVMVGDDWDRDVAPAASIGMPVYWISGSDSEPPVPDVTLLGSGTLSALWHQIQMEGLAL